MWCKKHNSVPLFDQEIYRKTPGVAELFLCLAYVPSAEGSSTSSIKQSSETKQGAKWRSEAKPHENYKQDHDKPGHRHW